MDTQKPGNNYRPINSNTGSKTDDENENYEFEPDFERDNKTDDANGAKNSEEIDSRKKIVNKDDTKESNKECMLGTNDGKYLPSMHKKKHDVIIFSDQYGKGLCKVLQELLGGEYKVSAIVKPNARIEQVLLTCENMCKDLTMSDYVVIIGGSNDVNPVRFNSTLLSNISSLSRTNVLLGEIRYNKYLMFKVSIILYVWLAQKHLMLFMCLSNIIRL